MFYFSDYPDDFNLILEGVKEMTKKKYEKELQELEEKEGKLFTVREIAELLREDEQTIHLYLKWANARTFKIWHYKARHNITLIPQDEVLKILVKRTHVLPMLKALAKIDALDCKTLSECIDKLEVIYEGS